MNGLKKKNSPSGIDQMQHSIVNYVTLHGQPSFRIDAEFYHPLAVKYEKMIEATDGDTIKGIGCKVVSGPFGSTLKSDSYLTKGVPFIRISDLSNFTIEKQNLIYISEEDNARLSSSQLKIGDLVLSKVGNTIGIVSIITEEIGKCNISENNIGIKFPDNFEGNKKIATLVYLNCYIGQSQILRAISGNAQPKLNVSDIEGLIIPGFKYIDKVLSNIVIEALRLNNKSQDYYKVAETILLNELSLVGWNPKHRLSFVNNYSDAQEAGRIDAEYFQPKYKAIVEAIRKYQSNDVLENIVTIKKCIEPGSEAYQDEGNLFLRVSNISKYGIRDGNQKYLSNELYEGLKKHQPKKGEILLTKDATPGIAYYLSNEPEKMIPSGGILRLTVRKGAGVLPEYLTLVLNSIIVQKQMERDAGGSIINHWLVGQIENTLIPKADDTIQETIAEKVNESFQSRKKAKALLEIAKRGVEIAIEKTEAEAEKWMKAEANKLGIELA
ncbi:hypothetical protein KAX06_01275 [candidate division WOR-3 bacterium]|nr:hypothetical protein [candidate division WOR-3 bacterium]